MELQKSILAQKLLKSKVTRGRQPIRVKENNFVIRKKFLRQQISRLMVKKEIYLELISVKSYPFLSFYRLEINPKTTVSMVILKVYLKVYTYTYV